MSHFFNFLGKNCDQNLECLSCYGDVVITHLRFRFTYSQCSCPISNCQACSTQKWCSICKSGSLAIQSGGDPLANSCVTATQCPDGSGYKDAYQAECVECPYEGCKACDLGILEGGCTECTTAGFKAIDFTSSQYLAPTDPDYGKKKCIYASTNVDGYYKDSSNYFRNCLSNCKEYFDSVTCTACGAPVGSTSPVYLVASTTPHRCTECVQANHEFLTEENTPKCIACPQNQRLEKGGTSSLECDPCGRSSGRFVDGVGYCDVCNPECSECSTKNSCSRCSDPGHNVQPDGSCKPGCPVNHKEDSNRRCQLFSCNVQGCLECSDHEVCSKCQNPLFLQPELSCGEGCPADHIADELRRCRYPICSIPDCLKCSADQVCQECQAYFGLESNVCVKKKIEFLDFVLLQQYSEVEMASDYTFLVAFDLQSYSATQIAKIVSSFSKISPERLKFSLSSTKNSTDEITQIRQKIEPNLTRIEMDSAGNIFVSINLTDSQKKAENEKYGSLRLKHDLIELVSDFENAYFLIQSRTSFYELKNYQRKGEHRLSPSVENLAKSASSVNNHAQTGAALTTLLFSLFSIDSGQVALRFNHFLSLIRSFQFVGSWLGSP